AAPVQANPAEVFDAHDALNCVGGDMELLGELVELLFSTYPEQLADLRDAIACRDNPRVQRIAHTLKGATSNFGAAAVVEAAQRLETMGRAGALTGAEEALHALEEAMGRLRPALTSFSREPRASVQPALARGSRLNEP